MESRLDSSSELRMEKLVIEKVDPREKMRSEIESIKESEQLYKKKLTKHMAMSAKKKNEQAEEEGQKNEDGEEK
ncbi:hypothetical protein PMAYCL1PPCAC_00182, partial [Pristionchus mayeri]